MLQNRSLKEKDGFLAIMYNAASLMYLGKKDVLKSLTVIFCAPYLLMLLTRLKVPKCASLIELKKKIARL